jgi:hypothetical protein
MPASPRLRALFLLLGIAAGFFAAVRLGHDAAGYSKPSNFKRLHQRISPEAAFYPPFAMLENLALAHWRPGLTVVIVGGNSILQGVGQNEHELWSLRLQTLLGDRYVVVNLSLRGAYPSEGGALVAESLVRRGIPVIYVANSGPGPTARAYESTYDFVFWDARAQGRLLTNLPRDTELTYRKTALLPAGRAKLATAALSANLNRELHFQELWHHISYRHFSTIWTYVTREKFWRPRSEFIDWEPSSPPLDQRFREGFDTEMTITRTFSQTLAEPDGAGGWRASAPSLQQAMIDIEEVFAPPLRPHMLMLLSQNCPYYRDRLTRAERARDEFVYATYEKLWRDHGIACVTAGTDFTPADYRDRTHLSPEGGYKLAELVAAQIRKLPSR